MRTVLALLSIFIFTNAFGQISYDTNVVKEYENAYKNLPAKYKEVTQQLEHDKGYSGGLVLTQIFIDDTLNKSDLNLKNTTIKILDTNGQPFKSIPESKMSDLLIMLIVGSLNLDTLNIKMTPWFFSNQTIQHTIIGDKIQSSYNEYYKYDSVLRANNSNVSTNDLTIPATTIKFVLNDKTFSSDKIMYEQAEIITDNFFYLSAYGFKNDTLKHRFHLKYYFKFKPNKNST